MKRLAKTLIREAEQLGYVHDRTNSQGYMVFVHPSGHEVQICPAPAEHQARAASKAMRKTAGTWQPPQGRNAQAVKDRTGRRRALDAARIAAERRAAQAERDTYLARIAAAPHLTADRESLRLVEARLRELDVLDSQMREVPAAGDHQGRRTARHTAGAV